MKPEIMGYKGSTNLEVGIIFAPYIPGGPVNPDLYVRCWPVYWMEDYQRFSNQIGFYEPRSEEYDKPI